MSITDELREYAKGWRETPNLMDDLDAGDIDGILGDIEHIADSIEAEHERLMQEQPFTIDMVPMTDERMAEHGLVRLPVDADGEYIRIGDVMQGEKIGGGLCEPFEVVGYIMSNGEFEPMDEHKLPRKRKYLHHHAPTVEDVLGEFSERVLNSGHQWGLDGPEIIAEYAAKLRLTDDGKEQ